MIEFAAHALSSDDSKHNTEFLLTQVKQLFSFKYPARVTNAKRNLEAYNCLIAACITQTPVAYKDVFKGTGVSATTASAFSSLIHHACRQTQTYALRNSSKRV